MRDLRATLTGALPLVVAAGLALLLLVLQLRVGASTDERMSTAAPSAEPADEAAAHAPPAAEPGPFADGIARSASWTGSRALETARADGRGIADELEELAEQPVSTWLGDWARGDGLEGMLERQLDHAESTGGTPVFVVYGIPGRDCGLYSAGGLEERDYLDWIERIAAALTGRDAAVVLEPDALAQLGDCEGQGDRLGLLSDATRLLAASGAAVYLDAGHSNWVAAEVMAERLQRAGVEQARGFATNVSNFYATTDEQAYAERIRSLIGGDYVIDVSRNGAGPQGEWCNPRGAALGEHPRGVDDGTGLDALLWIKTPGQSDGTCNGGPAAGEWWEQAALALLRNR